MGSRFSIWRSSAKSRPCRSPMCPITRRSCATCWRAPPTDGRRSPISTTWKRPCVWSRWPTRWRRCRASDGTTMQAHRIIITQPGGPDVLRYEPYEVGAPGPREALIRQTAIGLNYIDLHHRTGRYGLPRYPSPIGLEAAGIVEAVGDAVRELAPGDRIAYSAPPIGAYADW